jgi:hypothetical protein
MPTSFREPFAGIMVRPTPTGKATE